jgi:hypothetical protein
MGIESAAAAIDFAGLIDEAVRNKNGREEFDAASAQLNGIHEYDAVATYVLVQLQAQYNHCDEVASEKCLSAATFVRSGVALPRMNLQSTSLRNLDYPH